MTLEHALFIENNVSETKTIIHLCKFLKSNDQNKSHKTSKINPIEDDHAISHFYRKFGVVIDLSLSLEESKIFTLVKENLLPEVYCVIGKPFSGKTTISKYLCEQMNATRINFNDFISASEVK